MRPKLIISSIFGIATIGGATGGYYYFKSKDTEKTQVSVEAQNTPTTQNTDTQAKSTQPVQETPVQEPVLKPEGAQGSDSRGSSGSDAGRSDVAGVARAGVRGETGPSAVGAPG